MRSASKALRVQVFVGEEDRYEHRTLAEAIVGLLRSEGFGGATVVRGIEGYGSSQRIHSANVLRLSENLPVVITFIDTPERVEAVLPKLDAMIRSGGVVAVDEVTAYFYRGADETAG